MSTVGAAPRAAAPDTTSPTSVSPVSPTKTPSSAGTFANCAEAKAAGVGMIPDADPRYDPKLDHDGDGFACDAHGDPPTRHRPSTSTTPTITPTLPPCPPPER
jgi:hypothetical protein